MAPKSKSKASGRGAPEATRVAKLYWRPPFDNASKGGKFKVKQTDKHVRMTAVAECISRVEGQEKTLMRMWLDGHEGAELQMGRPGFKKAIVKLDCDEKRKKAEPFGFEMLA